MEYDLCAVMVHEGDNTYCGHYYDIIWRQENQKWYQYNDEVPFVTDYVDVGRDLTSIFSLGCERNKSARCGEGTVAGTAKVGRRAEIVLRYLIKKYNQYLARRTQTKPLGSFFVL